jgi:hypothetical protein
MTRECVAESNELLDKLYVKKQNVEYELHMKLNLCRSKRDLNKLSFKSHYYS